MTLDSSSNRHPKPRLFRRGLGAFGVAALMTLTFFAVCSLLRGALSAQDPEQLTPQGYVNDFANVLSQSAREQLTALCTEVEQKAQAQIAIVTVKSLGGRAIEDYSIDLATRWGVGPKQKDRGLMILLAVDDHKDRFEVGYGLEGILPDGKVGSFEREAVPLLRAGNYDGAVLLMTRHAADVIAADRGVTLSGSSPAPPPEISSDRGFDPGVLGLILFGVGILVVFAFAKRNLTGGGSGRHGGSGWWVGPLIGSGWGGGGFGGSAWGGRSRVPLQRLRGGRRRCGFRRRQEG